MHEPATHSTTHRSNRGPGRSNHGHMVALMHYNFCRVHKALRVTPAMEAGLTDHVWTISELAELQGFATKTRMA